MPAIPRRTVDTRTIVVRRPRTSDGVGSALRNAFDADARTAPDEWSLLIERIDRFH